jgi:diguanylate cyclase (GGDEF)-like protein
VTGPRNTVVVLTDGEPTLAHYMDQLRESGVRVLATARPYEAALFVARNDVLCLIARQPMLPDRTGEFLRRVRDANPAAFVVVTVPESSACDPQPALADLQLAEPFRYSSLTEALSYAAARQRSGAAPQPRSLPAGVVPAPGTAFGLRAPRLLACARRLSELERDRDQLLTVGLEMFLEMADAERGSLLLATPEQQLEVVRRSGFDNEDDATLAVAEQFAPEVARDSCPRIILSVPRKEEQRPADRTSCLVLPLLDQKTLVGVVALSDRRGGESFSEADLETTTLLARQFVSNLANASQINELHQMAVVDPLTKLFNRRYFERQFPVELERARRYSRQLTLAIIDIDKFKLFNDLNGYATGDVVIREVGSLLRSSFREVDIVTRWGGDEFAVILPETGKPRTLEAGSATTRNYVERVRVAIESRDFKSSIPVITSPITISAGVSTFPVDSSDAEALFQLANQALLKAKKSGHNRVCVAEPDVKAAKPAKAPEKANETS